MHSPHHSSEMCHSSLPFAFRIMTQFPAYQPHLLASVSIPTPYTTDTRAIPGTHCPPAFIDFAALEMPSLSSLMCLLVRVEHLQEASPIPPERWFALSSCPYFPDFICNCTSAVIQTYISRSRLKSPPGMELSSVCTLHAGGVHTGDRCLLEVSLPVGSWATPARLKLRQSRGEGGGDF